MCKGLRQAVERDLEMGLIFPQPNMTMKTFNIILLPGDGVGPEVVSQAHRMLALLNTFSPSSGATLAFATHLIGGCAIDAAGSPLPADTLDACRRSDAILLGAVGGPQWPRPATALVPHPPRPEQGLLAIRKELDLFGRGLSPDHLV